MESRFIAGLDLGQAADHSALILLEREGDAETGVCHLREAYRWPLGTSYPAIIEQLGKNLARLPKREHAPVLLIDKTGCGAPVIDLIDRHPFFKHAAMKWHTSDEISSPDLEISIYPVTITGGHEEQKVNYREWHIPKRNLVSSVAVLLQSRRLIIPEKLEHAPVLAAELKNFRAKVTTAGNTTFEAWRERDHDDLVLALALAAWEATRRQVAWLWA